MAALISAAEYQVCDEDDTRLDPDHIDYGFNLDADWERGGFLKEVSLESSWDKRGVYADTEGFTTVVPGSQMSVEGGVVLAPRSNLQWSFEGDWIRQTVDATGEEPYNALAYETALHYQLTRNLFLNSASSARRRRNSTASISSSVITSGPATSSSSRSRRASATTFSAASAATRSPSRSPTCSGSDPRRGR
jgi:hypothetical protein